VGHQPNPLQIACTVLAPLVAALLRVAVQARFSSTIPHNVCFEDRSHVSGPRAGSRLEPVAPTEHVARQASM
jgi:hypothetical protein